MLLLARRQHLQTDWKSSVAWLRGAMGGNQCPLSPDPATEGISSPLFSAPVLRGSNDGFLPREQAL